MHGLRIKRSPKKRLEAVRQVNVGKIRPRDGWIPGIPFSWSLIIHTEVVFGMRLSLYLFRGAYNFLSHRTLLFSLGEEIWSFGEITSWSTG